MTCELDKQKVSSSSLQSYETHTVLGKSLEECIIICNLLRPEKKCNAVKYFQTIMKCYLFALHKNSTTPETPYDNLNIIHVNGCKKGDVEVNSILIPAIHNMSYELCAQSRARAKNASNAFQRNNTLDALLEMESPEEESRIATGYVHLYRYMEICKINILYSRKVENVKKIQTIFNTRSVNKCMHYCQPFVRQSIYCAVEYSKDNYKCVLLLSSRTENVYFVGIDKHLIEVLECHPDRQDERRNNFPPLRFYFAETSEICVLEFHRSSLLSSFLLAETFQNVEHIKSCIWICRHRHYSYLCIAINYTMNKECNLFTKQWNATMYAVKPGSIFAEILLCEPGTLVDEILDF
ncbi:conserved hypothetical protein [Trichinella spiralis]|uniref:hypothetical protein n=1 Tax=Trichinella spiralis TaxID=6334 RepID=UPI0001EFB298|nr:conserved hypothetical protein [Trichinella spiralis]